MATYNGAKYIQDQLDSFICQTRLPDEVVISDDGSADSTLHILERFKEKAPFTVIILKGRENLGVAGNFDRALRAITGELVFLSDQDDFWFQSKLETMETIAESHPEAQAIICDAAIADANLNDIGLTKLGQARSAGLSSTNFHMGCCAAFRRSLLALVLPIPRRTDKHHQIVYLSHDAWMIKVSEALGTKLIIEDVLQYYRRHGGNLSGSVSSRLHKANRLKKFAGELSFAIGKAIRLTRGKYISHDHDRLMYTRMFLESAQEVADRHSSPPEAFGRFVRELRQRAEVAVQRERILKYERIRRIPLVVALWRNGGYRQYHGFYSGISDLVSPKNAD